jgi:hypothetical protein
LGTGTVRIDGGPPDFGYFHPGSPQWINENRGLRFRVDRDAEQNWTWMGLGLAVGATDQIEFGGLLLPLRLQPDTEFDDLELYGRFAVVDGDFELGVQVTGQLPTETEFGLGVGLPMLAHATESLRIDTGVELEVLFFDPTVANLDVPLALTWEVGGHGFLGPRTGVYVWDFDAVMIPAGIHAGVVLADGHLDLAAWFMWPALLHDDREDALEVSTFEFGFGINGRAD